MNNNEAFKNEQTSTNWENIKDMGCSSVKSERGNVLCITIVGEIEGHTAATQQTKATKYEHLLPLLVSAEEDALIDGLLVVLNTMGGDVEAGLAIAEMISGMGKPTVSLVLGGGHSIGVPLAVSAKRSYIASTATMTIHPIRMNGQIIGASQTFEYLKKVQNRVVSFVTKNSHVKREGFEKLMHSVGEISNDIGSILEGEEAVRIGLIDRLGGVRDALDCLYEMIADSKKQAN